MAHEHLAQVAISMPIGNVLSVDMDGAQRFPIGRSWAEVVPAVQIKSLFQGKTT